MSGDISSSVSTRVRLCFVSQSKYKRIAFHAGVSLPHDSGYYALVILPQRK